MVADLEELETMDASEIYSKRLNAKEVIFPKEKGEFIFPIADGRIKLSGGDQELRTSTLIRDHPIRGEGQRDFLGESEGSPPPPPQDSYPDAGEEINDFWSKSGNYSYELGGYARNSASMTFGISMDPEICLIIGQVSLSLLY